MLVRQKTLRLRTSTKRETRGGSIEDSLISKLENVERIRN
jgi:hypothetical protein